MFHYKKSVRSKLFVAVILGGTLVGWVAAGVGASGLARGIGGAVRVVDRPAAGAGRAEPMAFDAYMSHKPGGKILIKKGAHFLALAIRILQRAPHHFGGHRLAAIRDAKMALRQCRLALKFPRP